MHLLKYMLILNVFLKKVHEDDIIDGDGSYTKKYQKHVPCGFGYKVVCVDDSLIRTL